MKRQIWSFLKKQLLCVLKNVVQTYVYKFVVLYKSQIYIYI